MKLPLLWPMRFVEYSADEDCEWYVNVFGDGFQETCGEIRPDPSNLGGWPFSKQQNDLGEPQKRTWHAARAKRGGGCAED